MRVHNFHGLSLDNICSSLRAEKIKWGSQLASEIASFIYCFPDLIYRWSAFGMWLKEGYCIRKYINRHELIATDSHQPANLFFNGNKAGIVTSTRKYQEYYFKHGIPTGISHQPSRLQGFQTILNFKQECRILRNRPILLVYRACQWQ